LVQSMPTTAARRGRGDPASINAESLGPMAPRKASTSGIELDRSSAHASQLHHLISASAIKSGCGLRVDWGIRPA